MNDILEDIRGLRANALMLARHGFFGAAVRSVSRVRAHRTAVRAHTNKGGSFGDKDGDGDLPDPDCHYCHFLLHLQNPLLKSQLTQQSNIFRFPVDINGGYFVTVEREAVL
jgi:hypothetical protein